MAERSRILVAETERNALAALVQAVRQTGMDVVTASDAVHVLNVAKQEKPDVLILSSQLAGGGIAALRRVRSNVYTTNIPVIAVAVRGPALHQDLLAAGAQECLELPVKPDALHAAIQRNLLQSLDFTQAPAEVLEAPERMAEIAETGLLDSLPEEAFDLLTRLSTKLLDAPKALTTIVDKDRQFFKSQAGLDDPWASARQSRLSHSFCQWVVSGKEALVVNDATAHPVLKKNLAIRDMGVVAYAGVPLTGRSGQAIGSFCAIDSRAREWSADDLATLQDLARIAESYVHMGVARTGANEHLKVSAQVGGNAILGAARLLRRYHARISDIERSELLGIIERQAEYQLK